MKKHLRRVLLSSAAFIIAVASINIGGVAQIMTAHAASNNGTLKVHELGSLTETPRNEPQVCTFNFEAFGLDANQTGNVTIEAQNPKAPITPVIIPLTTDGSGNGQTSPYVNATGSPYTLQNGHYKATLDNKFGTDQGNKAKSKVFKVECSIPTPIKVTPAAPTFADFCGTANDTYTIPSIAGVAYLVNGQTVATNTYTGSGTVKITAVANNGHTLDGTSSWTFTFSSTPCSVLVTPAAPTKVDLCGTLNDTYTIPTTVGVKYYVNGLERPAGTYKGTGLVTITAGPAAPNYILQGTKTWVFLYTNLPCVVAASAPTKNDVCGRNDDTYTIPSTTGVRYFVNGTEKTAGTYDAPTVATIIAVAQPGYVLDLSKPVAWIFTYSNTQCPQPCHGGIVLRPLGINNFNSVVPCIPVQVTTTAPTFTDVCGADNDSYTIPSIIGVVYKVNGVITPAGTYKTSQPVTIIAAAADNGYVIANGQTTSWTFEFTNKTCPAADISFVAECSAQAVTVRLHNSGDADGFVYVNGTKVSVSINESKVVIVPTSLYQATVNVTADDMKSVLLDHTYDCTPGRGWIGGIPPKTTPFVTHASAKTSTTPSELPTTGGSSYMLLIIGVIMSAMTYAAVYYMQGRRFVWRNN